MFKRANKVTALLVAAASVMSIVPAMAATRIGTRDGHITGDKVGAIAYTDGKYVYDGYRTDEDNNGIYYNNGSDEKEKFNEDLRDYEITSKYGTKYAFAMDNNDQYLIDLTTGKIVDDETPEDKADHIKSDLRTKLKKTDRYSKTGAWDTIDLGDSTEVEKYDDTTRLFGNKFGEVWYAYSAKGDKSATNSVVGTVAKEASFTIKLPTVNAATKVGATTYTGTSLDNLYANILAGVKSDASVINVFDGKIEIVGSTIVGKTLAKGELSKTNAALVTFATNYGVTLAGQTVGDQITATGTDLNLDVNGATLKSATSSNQSVAGSVVLSGVAVITKGNAGKSVVTVTNSASQVATISVEVTSAAGVTTMTTVNHPYVDSAKVTAAVSTLSNSGTVANATVTTFTDLGMEDLVSASGAKVNGVITLSLQEAKDAITAYLATGKLGASITDAGTIRTILEAKLATKVAGNLTTDQVIVDRGAGDVQGVIGDPDKYIGFVNEAGKYIDVSATANVYVYSKAQGKTVRIKEYNKVNADYNIAVGLQSITPLAQDKDYIYALAKVAVLEGTNPVETQYFIQKISKAQGDDKDGAKLPKSVESYQVDNKTIFDDGDSQVAYNLLVNSLEDGFALDNVSAIDGSLYVTGIKKDGDHDKVKVFKIALKKGKIDTIAKYTNGTKKEDVDVYIAKKDGDTDMDVKEDTSATAVTYDVDGNTWVVSKGTITKITKTDKKDMFTCDRTFDHIDVYDEKNLIVWDKDSDVYSNVAEGTKVTQGESTAVAPVIVTGWVKGTDGTWTFNDATGTKVVSKWQNIGGVWYYLKADGIMATGWLQDGANWYYLQGSGAMATGWLNDNGTWYYLAGSGAMLSNTVVDGYTLGGSGAWVK